MFSKKRKVFKAAKVTYFNYCFKIHMSAFLCFINLLHICRVTILYLIRFNSVFLWIELTDQNKKHTTVLAWYEQVVFYNLNGHELLNKWLLYLMVRVIVFYDTNSYVTVISYDMSDCVLWYELLCNSYFLRYE